MKKLALLCVSVALLLSLSACGKKSPIQEATETNKTQAKEIESVLDNQGITYGIVNRAKSNKPKITIPDNCEVFNVIDNDGKNYFLVLNQDKKVVMILDSESKILYTESN